MPNEIVPKDQPDEGGLVVSTGGKLPTLAEIDERMTLFQGMHKLLFKLTKSHDWMDFSGKPWLTDAAAERFIGPLGICIEFMRDDQGNVKFERTDHKDEHGDFVIYRIYGTASIKKAPPILDVFGTSSTRANRWRKPKGQKGFIPLPEVNIAHVQQEALRDIRREAVASLLGLRGLSWDELATAGIQQGAGGTVTFAGSTDTPQAPRAPVAPPVAPQATSTPAPAPAPAPTPAAEQAPPPVPAPSGGRTISEKQCGLLYARAKSHGWDEEAVHMKLADWGYGSSLEIPMDQLDQVLKWFEGNEA